MKRGRAKLATEQAYLVSTAFLEGLLGALTPADG